MKIGFIVDANLPPSLASALKDLGHPVKHAYRLGQAASSDNAIWQHAIKTGAVIITKDHDYLQYLALDQRTRIVLDRRGNLNVKEMREGLLQRLPQILDAISQGESLIEII